jgi:hypothetical protein
MCAWLTKLWARDEARPFIRVYTVQRTTLSGYLAAKHGDGARAPERDGPLGAYEWWRETTNGRAVRSRPALGNTARSAVRSCALSACDGV